MSASKDKALAKNHFGLQPVNPEHLALAFHVACGVKLGKMQSDNPASKSVNIQDGSDVSEIAFTDIPANRAMFSILKELKSLDKSADSDESFQSRTAIMMRVWALSEVLRLDEISARIEKRDDGTFFLNSEVVVALSKAPLDRKTGKYKKKAFVRELEAVDVPPEYETLTLELPSELIGEGERPSKREKEWQT